MVHGFSEVIVGIGFVVVGVSFVRRPLWIEDLLRVFFEKLLNVVGITLRYAPRHRWRAFGYKFTGWVWIVGGILCLLLSGSK